MHKTLMTIAAVVLSWAGPAQAQQGPVGQGLNEAGRAMKRGFQTAGQAISGGFQKTRTSVHNMEVVSRVYSRIHWEKILTNATIEIEMQAGGVAILTGVVPNEEAKTRALSLTSDTVGVNQVVDQLTLAVGNRPAPVVSGTPTVISTPSVPTSSKIIVTSPSTVVIPPPATTTTKPSTTDTPL